MPYSIDAFPLSVVQKRSEFQKSRFCAGKCIVKSAGMIVSFYKFSSLNNARLINKSNAKPASKSVKFLALCNFFGQEVSNNTTGNSPSNGEKARNSSSNNRTFYDLVYFAISLFIGSILGMLIVLPFIPYIVSKVWSLCEYVDNYFTHNAEVRCAVWRMK